MTEEQKGIDFGAEEFPSSEIEHWQFYTSPSDEDGNSDLVQARIEPSAVRRMDDMIQTAKEKGLPITNRSVFVRVAVLRLLDDLSKHLQVEDELLSHWLLLKKEVMRQGMEIELHGEAGEVVRKFCVGLAALVRIEEYKEAKTRVNSFIMNILAMAGDQDFLMNIYIKQLFAHRPFQVAIEGIEKEVGLGPVIENARKASEKMRGESSG